MVVRFIVAILVTIGFSFFFSTRQYTLPLVPGLTIS